MPTLTTQQHIKAGAYSTRRNQTFHQVLHLEYGFGLILPSIGKDTIHYYYNFIMFYCKILIFIVVFPNVTNVSK